MVDVREKKEAENKQGSQHLGGSFSVRVKESLPLRENWGNTQTGVSEPRRSWHLPLSIPCSIHSRACVSPPTSPPNPPTCLCAHHRLGPTACLGQQSHLTVSVLCPVQPLWFITACGIEANHSPWPESICGLPSPPL